jgi:hypothetical protein
MGTLAPINHNPFLGENMLRRYSVYFRPIALIAIIAAIATLITLNSEAQADETAALAENVSLLPLVVTTDYGLCYREQDGIVIGEIEHAAATDFWRAENWLPGFTGSSYYTWRGPNYFYPHQAGQAVLRYAFIIQTPGSYKFRIHNFHVSSDPTEHNDTWTRIDGVAGGEWLKTFSDNNQYWDWRTYLEEPSGNHNLDPRYYFHPGVHYLEISPRSEGFNLDRFSFYLDSIPEEVGQDLRTPSSPFCSD